MKKAIHTILSVATVLCLLCIVCQCAMADKPVTFEQLPQEARTFILKYFPGETLSFAKYDDGEYDVIFTSGTTVEFNRKGRWTEISVKGTEFPAELIPTFVKDKVGELFPTASVVKISKSKLQVEAKLDNRAELEFTAGGRFIKID